MREPQILLTTVLCLALWGCSSVIPPKVTEQPKTVPDYIYSMPKP